LQDSASVEIARFAIFIGLCGEGRGATETAAHVSRSYETTLAAAAYALAGEESKAQGLAQPIAVSRAEDMFVQIFGYPIVQALIALNHSNANRTLELLRPAAGYATDTITAYVRGTAYLRPGNAQQPLHEF
jgi:hypothetical protein